jgi:hypothetical protein
MTRILAMAVAAAAIATPAHATPIGPICRQVAQDGNNIVLVCVAGDLGESGTTVAPTLGIGCSFGTNPTCELLFSDYPQVSIGTTGFVPNPSYTVPAVDPATGTVHVFAGTVGTLYVDGTPIPVGTPDLCIGDPSVC